ncbi:DUF2891 domain-containing protein [Robertkochia marina]|uniref:DUF2891 domain-containing protein n=1 Tax=Robertkochia marina TaxID=1227945 RepID=A0A4S3LZZ0_9FLAO|nr:DUF2891 domain-containing protein [Robertkochia marina]THD67684.1 DUF2891 domain-containing protein [Robertkochia marina]TRZ43415.1 DUF2891 domain-containing protein [Robertkochia marina]
MKLQTLTAVLLIILLLASCKKEEKNPAEAALLPPITLTLEEANRLAELPMHCMQTEYPNRLGQTLNDSTHLRLPRELHPAFYGCFDWHSSVHGHWSLVKLLKDYPEIEGADSIRQQLLENISQENIAAEVAYFEMEGNANYERTYGWAWLLKLAEELRSWDDPMARTLESNLEPLTGVIVQGYINFLPKLLYPIRVGEHPNTAFGLSFAWDYAVATGHEELKELIYRRAQEYYAADEDCPLTWEPGGSDFLSPCLEEADLMRRVLSEEDFTIWLKKFLPELADKDFSLEPGKVVDRADGKLVHLDGVNFSRAWCLYGIANTLPGYEHLKNTAREHIAYSLPAITDDNYEGTHWLGTFAIYALNSAQQ